MDFDLLAHACDYLLRGTAFVSFPQSSISSPSSDVRVTFTVGSSFSGSLNFNRPQWEAIKKVITMEKWENRNLLGDLFHEEMKLEIKKSFLESGLI